MSAPQTYCVTGANGFIGSHLVYHLLSLGHHVHGTVRGLDDAKVQFLHTFPNASTHLRLFAADLLQSGTSFQEAMGGTTGVFHCAGPWLSTSNRFDDHWKPIVEGTRAVITSAAAVVSVRRVVLVSSVAAVYCVCSKFLNKDRRDYNEEHWNDVDDALHDDECKKKTTSGNAEKSYFAAKTAAEKEAWQMVKEVNEKNSHRQLSLVSINSSVVIGNLLSSPTLETLNTSMQFLLGLMYGGDTGGCGVVDIDDVTEALVHAMTNPGAHGRYLCSGGSYTFAQVSRTLAKLYPDRCFAEESEQEEEVVIPRFDTNKIKTELNVQFKPLEETLKKAMDSLIQKNCVM